MHNSVIDECICFILTQIDLCSRVRIALWNVGLRLTEELALCILNHSFNSHLHSLSVTVSIRYHLIRATYDKCGLWDLTFTQGSSTCKRINLRCDDMLTVCALMSSRAFFNGSSFIEQSFINHMWSVSDQLSVAHDHSLTIHQSIDIIHKPKHHSLMRFNSLTQWFISCYWQTQNGFKHGIEGHHQRPGLISPYCRL